MNLLYIQNIWTQLPPKTFVYIYVKFGSSINSFLEGKMSIITGTTGNDQLVGTSSADKIVGDQGNDTIFGGDGNDTIYGDKDNISYFTGGNDQIDGGAGND